MGDKDNAFRRLLGDKECFLRFVRRFLKGNLPDELKAMLEPEEISLDDVILENVSFIPPDLREKRSDIVYRLRRNEFEAYVYILIEHQSSVDYLMAFRMYTYMGQLWSRCVAEAGAAGRRKSFKLPPILPVVFYDGAKNWTAVKRFTEKVARSEEFPGYIPNFEYRLISLKDLPDFKLTSPPDAVGTLLYLAKPFKSANFYEAFRQVRAFFKLFPAKEREVFGRHFMVYMKMLFGEESVDIEGLSEDIFDGEEAEDMLAQLEKELVRYKRECREEGKEEGREEGRILGIEEGREEGRDEALRLVVQRLQASGMAFSAISEVLKLSMEEVRRLAE